MADSGSFQKDLPAAVTTMAVSTMMRAEQAKTGGLQSKLPDNTELDSTALQVSLPQCHVWLFAAMAKRGVGRSN